VVLGVNVDLLILMDQLLNKNSKTIYSSSAPAPPPLYNVRKQFFIKKSGKW